MKTKKTISILCAALLTIAMTSCDKKKQNSTDTDSSSKVTTIVSANDTETESTTESTIESTAETVNAFESEIESKAESTANNVSIESKSEDSEAKKSDDNTSETTDDNGEDKTATETNSDETDTIEVKNGGLIYHIPSNFIDSKDNANGSSYYAYRTPDDTTASYLIAYSQDFPSLELNEAAFESAAQSIMKGYVKKAETDIDYKPTEIKHNTILGRNEYEMGYIIDSKSEEEFDYMFISFIQSPDIESINYVVQLFRFKDHEFDYDYIDDAAKMIYSVEEDPDFAD